MGQAKQRGSREERVKQAQESEAIEGLMPAVSMPRGFEMDVDDDLAITPAQIARKRSAVCADLVAFFDELDPKFEAIALRFFVESVESTRINSEDDLEDFTEEVFEIVSDEVLVSGRWFEFRDYAHAQSRAKYGHSFSADVLDIDLPRRKEYKAFFSEDRLGRPEWWEVEDEYQAAPIPGAWHILNPTDEDLERSVIRRADVGRFKANEVDEAGLIGLIRHATQVRDQELAEQKAEQRKVDAERQEEFDKWKGLLSEHDRQAEQLGIPEVFD